MERKYITFAKNAIEAVEKSGFVIGETVTCKEIVVTSEQSGKFCVTAKFSEVPLLPEFKGGL